MKLNESRLAVAAELNKKLERLNTAALFIYSCSCVETSRAKLRQQIREHPERALDALHSANTLLLLMRSEFFDCRDLAGDLVESLEHGTKCVLIPEPKPMPTGSEAAPTDQRGGAAK